MKRKTFFQFKQFAVHHDRCTMKVGTDAVLLGAWTNLNDARRVLDIGTGSGVIALMIAQRSPPLTHIDAIELEQQDALQAQENFAASPWAPRLHIHHTPLQQFHSVLPYDLIVSNPPYFINSLEPPDRGRQQARHTVTLDFDTLLAQSLPLLAPAGRLNVILPYTEGLYFITLAQRYGLRCSRQYGFRTRTVKPIERWLLEFTRVEAVAVHEEQPLTGTLQLYRDEVGETWSDDYVRLTGAFYLKA